MTQHQRRVIIRARKQLRLEREDIRIEENPKGLDEGWVTVSVGHRKGRPLAFDISPEGRVAY